MCIGVLTRTRALHLRGLANLSEEFFPAVAVTIGSDRRGGYIIRCTHRRYNTRTSEMLKNLKNTSCGTGGGLGCVGVKKTRKAEG